MTKKARLCCRNCGHKWEQEVYEKGEEESRKVRGRDVHCPKCNRVDIYEGW